MKKLMSLLIAFMLVVTFPITTYSQSIANTARHAIAIDGKTKEILFEKKAFENVAMASTTKIITALVAINYGNLDETVTISKNASSIKRI